MRAFSIIVLSLVSRFAFAAIECPNLSGKYKFTDGYGENVIVVKQKDCEKVEYFQSEYAAANNDVTETFTMDGALHQVSVDKATQSSWKDGYFISRIYNNMFSEGNRSYDDLTVTVREGGLDWGYRSYYDGTQVESGNTPMEKIK
jgi:hypothetical protein